MRWLKWSQQNRWLHPRAYQRDTNSTQETTELPVLHMPDKLFSGRKWKTISMRPHGTQTVTLLSVVISVYMCRVPSVVWHSWKCIFNFPLRISILQRIFWSSARLLRVSLKLWSISLFRYHYYDCSRVHCPCTVAICFAYGKVRPLKNGNAKHVECIESAHHLHHHHSQGKRWQTIARYLALQSSVCGMNSSQNIAKYALDHFFGLFLKSLHARTHNHFVWKNFSPRIGVRFASMENGKIIIIIFIYVNSTVKGEY